MIYVVNVRQHRVALKINGQIEQTKLVTVGGGSSRPVKFTVAKAQPGSYTVIMGSQRASFVVTGGEAKASPISGNLVPIIIMGALFLAVIVVLMFAFRRKS